MDPTRGTSVEPGSPDASPPATDAPADAPHVAPAPDPAVTPDVAPAPAAAPPADVDIGRRRFFRQFAGELVQTAATMAGAAQALQRASAEAAAGILDPATGAGMLAGFVEEEPAGAAAAGGPTGFRTPFREGPGVLYLIDQRRLPDVLLEIENRSAGEVAYSMRTMIVRGAPALGQVAAIGLALSRRAGPRVAAVRPARDAARRRQRPRPVAPDRGERRAGRSTG